MSAIDEIIKKVEPYQNELTEKWIKQSNEQGEKINKWDIELYKLSLMVDLLKAIGNYLEKTDLVKNINLSSEKGSITIYANILRNDKEYYFRTGFVYAGGYNVQKLHLRYLVVTNLPKKNTNIEYDRLNEQYKKMSKAQKIKEEIFYSENAIHKYEIAIDKAKENLKLSDSDVEKLSREEKPDSWKTNDVTWEEIVKRGADINFNFDKNEFEKTKREYRDFLIKSWRDRNANFKQYESIIKREKKEIEKLNKKLLELESKKIDASFDEVGESVYMNGGLLTFNNNRLFLNGKDIGLFEYTKRDNIIEIDRLYINIENQKKGIGRKVIQNIFIKNPDVKKILVYPLPSSESFWIRFTENVTKDGYFEITRNSFEVGNKKYSNFKNGGEILLAPNGKPSNLTTEQYKLVRTPEFISWFGDWMNSPETASKMLDDNGEPLVCYHGTNREFTVFRSDVGSAHDLGFYGRGFYFTFNPESNWNKYAKGEASYYGSIVKDYFIKTVNPFDFSSLSEYKGVKISYMGTESIVFLNNIAIKYPELSEIMKVQQVKWNSETQENDVNYIPISVLPELIEKYSKLLKTFETEDNFGEKNKITGYVKSEIVEYDYTSSGGTKGSYTSIDTLGTYDKRLKHEEIEILLVVDAIEKYERIEARYQPEGYMTRYPEITDLIKKDHDSIIQSKFGDEVVVFEPTQIKLADGTNITFDENNPDVRFNDGGGIDDKVISARKMQLRNKLANILKTLDYKTVDVHSGKSKEDLFIQRIVDMIYNGYDFKSKLDIERIATKEFGFDDAKKVRELTEYAILFVGRDISKESDVKDVYDKLVSLYANQPYSTNRTVKSQELGQFSTPAPMAYLMGVYVGINKNKDNKIYFEPTAGNGMLTIAGNPQDFVVNELDFNRYNNLLKDNYKLVLNQDATKPFNFDYKFDGLLANPPFATTKIDKIVDNFKISGLENQIMINSLYLLKDNARGAFIVGGHTEFDSAGRIKSVKDKAFLSYLYSRYNVEDVINVSGTLYGRQGTTYPIRIILFNGRKSIPSGYYPLKNDKLTMFEPFSHRVINNFDELYERFEKTILINQ